MISEISLNNFKKFQESTIILRPFSILMGENSCGKTTILQAINLSLSTLVGSELISTRNNGNILARNKGIGATSLPGINISDFRELYYGKVSRQGKQGKVDNSKIGARITLKDENNNFYRLQVSSLFGGYNLKCLSSHDDLCNAPTLHNFSPLFISGFVGLQEVEQRSFPVTIRHYLSSGNVSAIIRNLVLDLKKNNPNNYQLLSERLAVDFNFYLDKIDFNEQNDEYLTATYKERCKQKTLSFDFNSSGSGYMQVLQILAPIYTVCPKQCKVVLLDEPDAHLHPNMQIALARSLKRIQKELNIQIIISTHSPAIIKTAQPTEVIPIDSKSLCNEPLSSDTQVSSYIGQLDNYELAKSVISGKMLFIEDSNTEIIETFDKLLNSSVFFGANTISIHTGRSKDDKIPFSIKPLLKQFLGKDIEIHFIRDSDGLDATWKERLLNYAKKNNVTLHLLNRYEIENYILNSKVIHRALKSKFPDKEIPEIHDIEQKIKEYLNATISMSKFKYDDNLEDSIFKTSLLLKLDQYRGQNNIRTEAERMRSSYETFDTIDNLITVGMGKETLKLLFKWLNEDRKLNLCKEDVLEAFTVEDIPDDIKKMLKLLRSNIADTQIIDSVEAEDQLIEQSEVNETYEESAPIDRFMQLNLFQM